MNNLAFSGGINRHNTVEIPVTFQNELDEAFSPLLESVIGKDFHNLSDERKSFITRAAWSQYKDVPDPMLNESSNFVTGGYSTPTNVSGMGNPSFGSTLGGQTNFNTGSVGSGDKYISPFAVAMQVAAKTIGFDLVPTIPISAPTGSVHYIDYEYSDGKLNGTGNDNPVLIRLANPNGFNGTVGSTYIITSAYTAPTASGNAVKLKYVGKTRILGEAIFQVTGSGTTTSNVVTDTETIKVGDAITGTSSLFVTGANVSVANTLATVFPVSGTPALVNAFEDQVFGFAGGKGGNEAVTFRGNFYNGTSLHSGATRGESEESAFRQLGLKAYSRHIETQEFKIKVTVSQQMLQDMKRLHNFDVIAKAENALVNETTQDINKNILSTLYAMGWTNHKNILSSEGENFNLNLKTGDTGAAAVSYIDNKGTLVPIAMPDFEAYGASTTGFENRMTIVERLVAKIRYASMMIHQRGRRGEATFVVTNLKLAAAIKSISGFTLNPFQSNFKSGGDLYPIGTLEGLTVYVDPYLTPTQNVVLVGRKGQDDEPGLKFCSYILSESVSTIAEATMSPAIASISRYALVEYGQYPETQYLTFEVKNGTNGLI